MIKNRLNYRTVSIFLYCSVAIPIVPLKELHCEESAIKRCILYMHLHLHMSPVLKAHKLARSCRRQCITKMNNYFFPKLTMVHLLAVYPMRIIVPRVENIYASMHEVDTIHRPMVLV
jgi:hypothetical protein